MVESAQEVPETRSPVETGGRRASCSSHRLSPSSASIASSTLAAHAESCTCFLSVSSKTVSPTGLNFSYKHSDVLLQQSCPSHQLHPAVASWFLSTCTGRTTWFILCLFSGDFMCLPRLSLLAPCEHETSPAHSYVNTTVTSRLGKTFRELLRQEHQVLSRDCLDKLPLFSIVNLGRSLCTTL